jgi:hypothetical protein
MHAATTGIKSVYKIHDNSLLILTAMFQSHSFKKKISLYQVYEECIKYYYMTFLYAVRGNCCSENCPVETNTDCHWVLFCWSTYCFQSKTDDYLIMFKTLQLIWISGRRVCNMLYCHFNKMAFCGANCSVYFCNSFRFVLKHEYNNIRYVVLGNNATW